MHTLRSRLDTLGPEVGPTLSLAWPVVLGQVGVMAMSVVDTLMVGRLGPTAVAALGVGGAVYSLAFFIGLGVLLGLDRVASVAFGAGDHVAVARAYVQGLLLGTVASGVCVLGLLAGAWSLPRFGVDAAIVPEARRYLYTVAPSLVPVLWFTAARQTLQATGDTRAATAILLVANVVNFLADYALIEGRWGFAPRGVEGAALATLVCRGFMAVAMLAWGASRGLGLRGVGLRPHGPTLRELLRLGLPAGAQLVLEGGVFSLASVLVGRLGATPAAAHQVVLQVASLTFMVPLGLSAAGAVRVGQSLGRGDPRGAARAGWTAVLLGGAFMLASGLTLLGLAAPILGAFSLRADALALARTLLLCAALFQLFDGLQVTLAGVLRGLGDTASSLVANLVGHWGIGLPVGVGLAFGLGLGAVGMWVGLATGLAAVAVALLVHWTRRSRAAYAQA